MVASQATSSAGDSSAIPRSLRLLLPVGGAAVIYGASLHSAQIIGRICRVSCASFGWSSLLGCFAVSCSSLAAGQVSFAIQRYLTPGANRLEDFIMPKEDAVISMISGLVAFKAFGGNFCNLMPSNICHPGALANFSLAAAGPNQASQSQYKQLQEAFKLDGCHHCGSRTGKSIADHIPPNVIIKSLQQQRNQSFFTSLFRTSKNTAQRFYPQCINCMKRQSAYLLNGKDPFVYHFRRGFPKPPYLAGFLVGTFSLHASYSDNFSYSRRRR